MVHSEAQIREAVNAFKDGAIELDGLLAIAGQSKTVAEMVLLDELTEPHMARNFNVQLGLLEALWKLCGPTNCLAAEFAAVSSQMAVNEFLQHRLKHFPEDFSDDDLQMVKARWSKGLLPLAAQEVLNQRTAERAKHLQENPKEMNADVRQVQAHVSQYNFPEVLNEVLQKVDAGLAERGDQFDQAALLKHLRTFFEQLHQHAGQKLRQERPGTVDGTDLTKCGQALEYLQRNNVLTDRMFQFGKALYGVLSESGVHAIQSEKEYVRLCRNMVAEYALILFFELDRRIHSPG